MLESVTEPGRAQEALRESEARYRYLFENSPVSLWEEDFSEVKRVVDGLNAARIEDLRTHFERHPEEVERCAGLVRIKNVNQATLALYGASDKRMFEEGLRRFSVAESYGVIGEEIIALASGQGFFAGEIKARTFLDEKRTLSLRVTLAPEAAETWDTVLVSLLDITDRKQAEEALQRNQAEVQTILDSVPAWIFYKDKENRFIRVNTAFAEIMGMRKEELEGRSIFDLYPQEQAEAFWKDDQEVIASGKPKTHIVEPMDTKKGRLWAETDKIPYRDLDGQIIGVIGFSIDTTERKRTQETLDRERTLLNTLMDNIPDYIYFKDLQSRFIRTNKAHAKAFGLGDPAEATGKTDFDFFTEEHARAAYEDEQSIIRTGLPIVGLVEKETWPNRPDTWVSTTKMPLRDEKGIIVGTSGISRDITELRRADEARRLDSQIMANMVDGVSLIRAGDGIIVYANPRFEKMFGYGRGEMNGKHVSILNAPTDKSPEETANEIVQALERNGQWTGEVNNLRKDGTPFWCDASVSTFTHSEYGTVWVSVHQDITDRRRMEAELQESNARLTISVDRLEQSSREIALLGQMGDLLQSCRNAEEAYQVIERSGRLLFPAETGALFVLNNSRNQVEMMASWDEPTPSQRAFTLDDCWGLRRGRAHVVESSYSEVTCAHLAKDGPPSYLCIPMMAQGETIGVLHLRSRLTDANPAATSPNGQGEHFSSSKQQLAATIAEHIALSLASLRLRETLRHQAIRDPLTGLFNRRYMEETIERELHRATRNGAPLGVIMFDIDHFKEFNDNFGHAAGDAILRELGTYLESKIRHEDIACRYGGDEFILVLPECPIETTRQRAEQLREAFKSLDVRYLGQSLPMVTLSLGVAVFSEHGSSAESLLRKADQALYRAKAEGSDRVLVAI
jgi:diguanylate cyclase (GGDEF)-like protein/PAS domain S-box-containing protein